MICPHCGKEITPHDVASFIGKHTSEAKAKASKANGAKGGRPRKDAGANKPAAN